ncbi:MAG: hydrogenase nickel incorporation protein HypB [Eggerthellaceae bacterium]|nr:hydrogenase nickel incorporation protein HypB [Eggerthellaceae bacterium]
MQSETEQLVAQNRYAQANRRRFTDAGVFALNVLASPDSGKTSVIVALIDALRDEFNIAVIAGDMASSRDFARVNRQGIAAVQVDTGDARCLDAALVAGAASRLDLDNLDLVIMENAGSLVFPTGFDLGEDAKVAMLSVSEGDHKPLEHPGLFQAAQAIVLNKVDTMHSVGFNEQVFRDAVKQLNPSAPVFPLSATTGQGVEVFAEWLADLVRAIQ